MNVSIKFVFLSSLIFTFLLVSGCSELDLIQVSEEDVNKLIKCDAPYIRHASGCCLDIDENSICDDDEISGDDNECVDDEDESDANDDEDESDANDANDFQSGILAEGETLNDIELIEVHGDGCVLSYNFDQKYVNEGDTGIWGNFYVIVDDIIIYDVINYCEITFGNFS